MPALAALLVPFLVWLVSGIIGRIIFSLGVGFVEYLGIQYLIDQTNNFISGLVGGLPAPLVEAWTVIGFQVALNMIMTAYAMRITIIGVRKLTFIPATPPV